MGKDSGIQWTNHTFNPWWGCEKVSQGCKHCYAEGFAVGRMRLPIWGGATTSRRFFGENHWHEPKRWNLAAERAGKRARVFCASMADVCEDRDDLVAERARLARLILSTPSLDWLLLTKRPQNFVRLFGEHFGDKWPANVWAGTTVESQEMARERIPHLLQVPARVRFLSCEPLLGPLDLTFGVENPDPVAFAGERMPALAGIDWAIVGGESGKRARMFDLAWARSLQEQCKTAGVACFIKQMGENAHVTPEEVARGGWGVDAKFWQILPGMNTHQVVFRDSHGGDMAEWPEDLRVREFPR